MVQGKRYGPHAFFTDLRKDGKVVEGIGHGDMGPKTVGNDLDNAWISFHNVRLPKSAMLNRYADIDPVTSEYRQILKGLPAFHMIGQRLFSGRVAVAQAALTFRRALFRSTKVYTDTKICWSPSGDVPLSSIPQLKALYKEAEENDHLLSRFVELCENDLSECLLKGEAPDIRLVEAIAVAKVKCVEDSIALVHRLRNEVGSYALMKDSGFGQTDFLQCCKFAEGDSRILMQKMVRDCMAAFTKGKLRAGNDVKALCSDLADKMNGHITSGLATDKHAAWDECWREVYHIAEAVMSKTMGDILESRK